MDNPMGIDGPTYALASSATSSYVTLTPGDRNSSRIIITNITAYPVYVMCSDSSSSTAAFPTSATVPVNGKVIPSGSAMTYAKRTDEGYVHAISSTLDSGKYIYFSIGSGE